MEKLDLSSLAPIFTRKLYTFFFISNQVTKGLNVKNALKIKQLAKQLPTLNINTKNFGWTLSKKIYFFNFKLDFSTTFCGTT